MAKKEETKFRNDVVAPFLATLKNTESFPIQQVAIIGDPDYLLCCRGWFVALELKRPGGKPRKKQQDTLNRVTTRGKGIALVASLDNWEDIKEVLSQIDQGVRR